MDRHRRHALLFGTSQREIASSSSSHSPSDSEFHRATVVRNTPPTAPLATTAAETPAADAAALALSPPPRSRHGADALSLSDVSRRARRRSGRSSACSMRRRRRSARSASGSCGRSRRTTTCRALCAARSRRGRLPVIKSWFLLDIYMEDSRGLDMTRLSAQ